MGVPVVTLASDRFVGRISSTVLHALGHEEWIARDPAEYLKIAAGLASDRDRMVETRKDARARFMDSALCDGAGLARALEQTYRSVWQEFCAQGTL
jgi:protein O-GlcNAc transferase